VRRDVRPKQSMSLLRRVCRIRVVLGVGNGFHLYLLVDVKKSVKANIKEKFQVPRQSPKAWYTKERERNSLVIKLRSILKVIYVYEQKA
jgi:hypothetical protein